MFRLFATCYGLFFLGVVLAVHILGDFEMGLMVSDAAVHIRLI